MQQIKQSQIEEFISDRREFAAYNASAKVYPSSYQVVQAELNDQEFSGLLAAAADGRASYVVYSYETPVAWIVDGQPHVTEQKFSATTSTLQNRCRRALA